MPGDAFEESGHLGDLGRRLALMAIEQEPQDQLEALEVDDVGQRTNRLGLDAFVDERRRPRPQLVFPGLQRRRANWTRRSVLAQIRARQANEEGIDVRLQRSWKVRPRENIDLPPNLSRNLDIRPIHNLSPTGVPGPDDRVPGLLGLGAESIVEDRLVIGLEIREAHLIGSNASSHSNTAPWPAGWQPDSGRADRKALPTRAAAEPFGVQAESGGQRQGPCRPASEYCSSGLGKAPRLRRYRLQPLPQSGGICVDLAGVAPSSRAVVFTAEIWSRF